MEPFVVIALIALALYANFILPNNEVTPVYDSSVRMGKDYSGQIILLLLFAPLVLAIIVGAVQRLSY